MKLKRMIRFYLVLPAFSLAACQMMGPDYFRPKQALPATYQEAQSSDAAKEISNQWWTLYQDETLNDLIAKASKNNPDLKIAVARIEEADGYMREVGAALFPQVNLDSSGNRYKITELGATPLFNGMSPTRNNFNVKLSTTFELDFWGKLRRAQESGRAQALASRYAKDTVDLSLRSLVTGDIFCCVVWNHKLSCPKEALKVVKIVWP